MALAPECARAAALAALVLATGCGGRSTTAVPRLPESPRATTPASVLRVPRGGGLARLYRIPDLSESEWKAREKLPALKQVVGGDLEQRIVFALDAKRNLIGLDLESGHVRTFLPEVREAAIGPDGSVYAVDTGGVVTQFVRRAPVRFRDRLAGTSRALYGTMDGSLIAIPASERSDAEALGPDQATGRAALPRGDAAATFLGDLVAIAADSAVVLYQPQAKRATRTVDVEHARAVAFSPSGHRLYVADAGGGLRIIDRFSGETLKRIALPGPARELRGDFYGAWLLARPERGDSVWVVDAASGRIAGTVLSGWSYDLPAVAGHHTLLLRAGADLSARDLSAEGLPSSGTVEGGAADIWLPLAWLPATEEAQLAAADSAAADSTADSAAPAGAGIYLQVSSSRNPSWAGELADKLKAAGVPASVLPPKQGDEAYRVVLGPYATREQAEAAGKTLGMPSFVVTPQDRPAQ